MRCGVRAVLRILFCALGFGVVLGGALILKCIWDFGVGFGRCIVYCGFGRVDLLGGLRNGVKV